MSKTMLDPQANPDRIARVLERRRSNASGIHADKRNRRQRTRSASNRAAIKAAS